MRQTILSLLFISFLFPFSVFADNKTNANKQTEQWRYELEPMGEGQTGVYKIKVWSYSKKQKIAQEQCKKNAVHGIIFKGIQSDGHGTTSKKPLVPESGAEEKYSVFFRDFFAEGGDYMKFINIVNPTPTVIKVNKEYKIGVVVTVQKDNLRKHLESAGVIRSLNSGF